MHKPTQKKSTNKIQHTLNPTNQPAGFRRRRRAHRRRRDGARPRDRLALHQAQRKVLAHRVRARRRRRRDDGAGGAEPRARGRRAGWPRAGGVGGARRRVPLECTCLARSSLSIYC